MRTFFQKSILVFTSIFFTLIILEISLRIIDPLGKKDIEKKIIASRKSVFPEPLPQDEKKDGEFRVLVLGDSFTWGDGIDDVSEIWPHVLEDKLNSGRNKNINVINMGMCGLTTVNEFELLIKVGVKLKPDLVLVQFLVNDTLPSAQGLRRVGEDWMYKSKPKNLILSSSANDFFEDKSYLYSFINERFLALQRKIYPSVKWDDLYKDDFPGFIDFKKALSGFKYWQDKNNVKVVFFLFPNLPKGKWSEKKYPYSKIYAKVSKTMNEAGLDNFSLLPLFIERNKDFSYWHVSKTNAHPNIEANKMIANRIYDVIEEKKYIN